jgi:hypothetical protein
VDPLARNTGAPKAINQRSRNSHDSIRKSKRETLYPLVESIASSAAGEAVNRADGWDTVRPSDRSSDDICPVTMSVYDCRFEPRD